MELDSYTSTHVTCILISEHLTLYKDVWRHVTAVNCGQLKKIYHLLRPILELSKYLPEVYISFAPIIEQWKYLIAKRK